MIKRIIGLMLLGIALAGCNTMDLERFSAEAERVRAFEQNVEAIATTRTDHLTKLQSCYDALELVETADGKKRWRLPVLSRTPAPVLAEARRLWQPETLYLNTASYGLPPRPAWDALQAALADWRGGRTSWEGWGDSTEAARASFYLYTTTADIDALVEALHFTKNYFGA